jgi:hypothetical protein
MQLSKPPKPKATIKSLKKEILSDDFKKRKIFWKILRKIFHLTSLTLGLKKTAEGGMRPTGRWLRTPGLQHEDI